MTLYSIYSRHLFPHLSETSWVLAGALTHIDIEIHLCYRDTTQAMLACRLLSNKHTKPPSSVKRVCLHRRHRRGPMHARNGKCEAQKRKPTLQPQGTGQARTGRMRRAMLDKAGSCCAARCHKSNQKLKRRGTIATSPMDACRHRREPRRKPTKNSTKINPAVRCKGARTKKRQE